MEEDCNSRRRANSGRSIKGARKSQTVGDVVCEIGACEKNNQSARPMPRIFGTV